MGVAKAILTEASLSFLGLGDPMLSAGARWCMTARPICRPDWWISTLPGLSIMLIVVIFYMIGGWAELCAEPEDEKAVREGNKLLLEAENLCVSYRTGKKDLKAVDRGFPSALSAGDTLGIHRRKRIGQVYHRHGHAATA